MASSSRGVQQDSFIDEDDLTCPLCVEEFDLSDRNFRPCPCGYQVCQFCFNNIKNNMNGLCPACRRPYDEKTMEFKIVTPEEIAQFKAAAQKNAKKKAAERQKEAQKREVESLNRKHLAGLRVIQRNLVYVVGLSPGIPENDLLKTLRGDKYFGQYGQIIKIVVSKAKAGGPTPTDASSLGVYVTFARKEDAARCIAAVNGSQNGERVLRAQLGTTKYCSAYLRNEICTNKQCMFLHEPGDNDESYSRQDLSSINSVSTQRPLPVSTPSTVSASRQAAQAQAPIQQAQPVAAASQPMARDLSKDGSDSGDGSALPSTASWAKGGISVLSRRNSGATSVTASSPAVSHSVPVQDESAGPVEHLSERAAEKAPADTVAPEPEPSESPRSRYDPVILSLLKSIRAMSTCQQNRTAQDPDIVEIASNFPSLLDDQGGLKRRLMREQMEESAQLSEEQDPRDIIRSVEEDQEEAPESGSGQLGGEPEDREERDNQPPGFPDQRRPSAQLPIQRGVNDGGIFGGALGQSFQGLSNLSSINGRTLTPDQQRHLSLLKSTPTGFSESNYPPGMGMPGQSHQGHNRQSSRFSFSGEGGAKIASTQKLGGNPNMMVPQQGNQFYGNSMPGPPPGLKSTGTPPMNGFGQHGFGGLGASAFGGSSREGSNEMLREMIRNRGGMTGGQGHDAGKREFMFPSYPHQYPSSSTPAPASGLLASLYGPQPGAFHDFGLKQKKKGKKHRHANTSSSGGSALVDLADPNSMQSRMALHHAQGNAGVGQGLFGGQAQGGYGQNSMYGAGASGFRW